MEQEKKNFLEKHHDSKKFRVVVGALTILIVYIATIYSLIPHRLDVSVGEIMPTTVYATKKVEDKVATQNARQRMADSVGFQYSIDTAISDKVVENYKNFYKGFMESRNYAYQNSKISSGKRTVSDSIYKKAISSLEIKPSKTDLIWLVNKDQDEILKTFADVESHIISKYSQGIYETDVSSVKGDIIDAIDIEHNFLYTAITSYVNSNLVANMMYNEVETQNAKTQAMESVEPTYYTKGQVVVYEGETLTTAQYNVLTELGMVGGSYRLDIIMFVGVALALSVIFAYYYFYFYYFARKLFRSSRYFFLTNIIVVITVVTCVLVGDVAAYLMPISLAGLLTVALINRKVALLNNIVVSGIVGIIQRNVWNPYSVYISIISVMFGIYSYDRKKNRFGMIIAGGVTAVVNFTLNVAYAFISENSSAISYTSAGAGVVSIVISTIICIGVTVLFEGIFNVLTPAKLVELSSTDHKLLKELVKKAPGTYHHSVLVANLAESAANAVGADALLTRVAAYYHDIGKIAKPMYFKENQQGNNVHDSLSPIESAKILTNHTIDGYRLAQKEMLPGEIKDIIVQHHGTTLTKFFYDKAIDMGLEVDEKDFRYKGPKPQTKEAAIIMLADTLEAVMRVNYDETTSKTVIKNIINGKIKDGQLDDCELSFKDITKIADSFDETFKSIYHKRIAYKDNEELNK